MAGKQRKEHGSDWVHRHEEQEIELQKGEASTNSHRRGDKAGIQKADCSNPHRPREPESERGGCGKTDVADLETLKDSRNSILPRTEQCGSATGQDTLAAAEMAQTCQAEEGRRVPQVAYSPTDRFIAALRDPVHLENLAKLYGLNLAEPEEDTEMERETDAKRLALTDLKVLKGIQRYLVQQRIKVIKCSGHNLKGFLLERLPCRILSI